MEPIYFRDQFEFREWLGKNHKTEREILVGFYKVKTGVPTMTWSESVDQALCFGWIDGIRRSIDENRYCIRFTPRKPGSNWSNVNIKKVMALKKKGLMKPEGLSVFNKRKKPEAGTYSFERENSILTHDLLSAFEASKNAWDYFNNQPPSYRKTMIYWIMSAKQEATRKNRLNKLILACENKERIF